MPTLLMPVSEQDDEDENALEKALLRVPLEFIVRWAPGGPLALSRLVTVDQTGSVKSAITHVIGDNDGEISVQLGAFDPSKIEVRFSLFAAVKIPRLATYIKVGNLERPLFPHEDFAKMERGDRLRKEIKFQIPEVVQ